EFHRYANRFYSSTVGGSMYAISEHPQFARICLCGMLFQPKRSGGRQLKSEDQSFLESWEKAQASQQLQSEAEERLEKRLRAAVRSEDFQQLAVRLEAAEKTVAQLQAELKGRHLKARRKRSARK